MRATHRAQEFDVVKARELIHDLFTHRQWIYWLDMLGSVTVGYAAAGIYLASPTASVVQIAALAVASFALFRVGSFIHEIIHFKQGQMTAFRVVWNIVAGIPMLMPSFFYGNHLDHHSAHHYGTGQDGEYLPLGTGRFSELVKFFLQVLFLPLQMVLRFLILTPISFLHPKLRTWILERMSSYVINPKYRRREIPAIAPRGVWAALEIACFVRSLGLVAAPAVAGWLVVNAPELAAKLHADTITWWRLGQMYVLSVCVLGLNYIRNTVAHRYESHGEPLSHADQLLDSVNITGGWVFTELFFPLGLRYHALHHLYATLPYHSLFAAHARLMDGLPADSPYRDTVFPSFWAALGSLLHNEREAAGQTRTGADEWYERREEMLARRARGETLFPSEKETAETNRNKSAA